MTEAADAIRDQDRLLPIANIRYTKHKPWIYEALRAVSARAVKGVDWRYTHNAIAPPLLVCRSTAAS